VENLPDDFGGKTIKFCIPPGAFWQAGLDAELVKESLPVPSIFRGDLRE
jgi:hypothetical protein